MKFIVEKAEVVYTTVVVEVSDDFEGDLELEARWRAWRGLGQTLNSQKCTAEEWPWKEWHCEETVD